MSRRNTRNQRSRTNIHGNRRGNEGPRNVDVTRYDQNVRDNDREIRERTRARTLENGPEIVLSHHENTPAGNSKNQDMAQSEKGQAETGIHEMKKYLQGVLAVINEFDNKLTSQLNTNQTLSDRS